MRVLLVMRKGFGLHADHIRAVRHMGADVHLVTEVPQAEVDGRFASVMTVAPGEEPDVTIRRAADLARELNVDFALTFTETDILIASTINQLLGKEWARPEADMIARDKRRQREFLAARSIPSVRHIPISRGADAAAAAGRLGYPLIVKPTRAAFSKGVALVRDRASLEQEIAAIERMVASRAGNYFEGQDETFALLEEFLPGQEVTLDGIVVSGQFHLAGIINKMYMPGPYFQENYYSLPFKVPGLEAGLAEIAAQITSSLGLRNSLFNVELRQDASGAFRVIEFSTRMSGDYNYHNLREVHGIDLVRLYVKALCSDDHQTVWSGEVPRLPARRTTCISYLYRSGLVLRNSAGEAARSPFFQTYAAIARPGDRLALAPEAYEIAGALNVAAAYRELSDVDRVEDIAVGLEKELDLVVAPDGTGTERLGHATMRQIVTPALA